MHETSVPTEARDPPKSASVLQALGLVRAEIAALAKSGSIYFECRGRSTVIAKLRFQVGGKTHAKYLGVDSELVACVQSELNALQAGRQRRGRLREAARDARHALKKTKAQLGPCLAQAGLRFHGRRIRRCRKPSENQQFTTHNGEDHEMSPNTSHPGESTLVASPAPENSIRHEQIERFVSKAIDNKDDFVGMVAAATGDHFRLMHRFSHVLEQSLIQAPDAPAAIADTRQPLVDYVRIGQMAYQYAQLTRDLLGEAGTIVEQQPPKLGPARSEETSNSAPTRMGDGDAGQLAEP